MTEPFSTSRVEINVDLHKEGRQIGDLRVKWSDNDYPIGYYLTPIVLLSNGSGGPTVLLTGGVHGDEFEGPAALMRLAHNLDVTQINGRIMIIPAVSAPAIQQSSRVSPVDGWNMNRAFPGDVNGSPTSMIAHYIETALLPQCDAAIDLHSGGKAAVFANCVLAQVDPPSPLAAQNMALAKAFGAPYLWLMDANNDDRSLNAAAARQHVPTIAAELGGGGGCDPGMTDFAEAAIKRCLAHLGLIPQHLVQHDGESTAPAMEPVTVLENFYSPATGLFDRCFRVTEKVEAGQSAGWLHFVEEPARPSMAIRFSTDGLILAATNRGMVKRGDLIAIIAEPCQSRLANPK